MGDFYIRPGTGIIYSMSKVTEEIAALTPLPLLALKNMVVLPRQITAVGVGRRQSVAAVEEAVTKCNSIMVLATQRNDTDDWSLTNLYPIGVIARVAMAPTVQRAQEFTIHVEGIVRITLKSINQRDEAYWAHFETIPERDTPTTTTIALRDAVKNSIGELIQQERQIDPQALVILGQVNDPDDVADMAANMLGQNLSLNDRIDILQDLDLEHKLRTVLVALQRQKEISRVKHDIEKDVRDNFSQNNREMILREQERAIRKELAEMHEDSADPNEELRARVANAHLPEPVLKVVNRELARLNEINSMSPELGIVRNYLGWILDLPWQDSSDEKLDLQLAAKILDEDHYGLPKIKERILEWMAVRQRVLERRRALGEGEAPPPLQTPILCFVGPPGVGKTSLGRSIARALGRKLVRISLGGIRDEAEIRGHRRTYIGALPGRVIQAMKQAGTKNAVMMLDEIDKVGLDFRGDPAAALLEVLDPEQNREFSDHYLEVPYDLSQVLFITTANVMDTISAPLRDRMEIIEISGYTEEEKLEIAKQHLVPRQLQQHALAPEEVSISDGALRVIIRNYTHEAGVRGLERQIAQVMRKIPRQLVEHPELSSVAVGEEQLVEYLGPLRFDSVEAEPEDKVGVANGVVVSDVGGDLVAVEALSIPGPPGMQLTGQLGEVMQESARAALSWVRGHAEQLQIKDSYFNTHYIHIHVPAGAIPKEGPSAGVTLATAIASVASNRPIRHDLAMTGEITLRGRVLPIGGVKDKLLAAHRAGIGTFLLPERNLRDLHEIEPSLLSGMNIILVKTLDEVLEAALLPPENPPQQHRVGFAIHQQIPVATA